MSFSCSHISIDDALGYWNCLFLFDFSKFFTIVLSLVFFFPCTASQKACTTDEFLQFPSRLLEWFMHLKEKNEFGRIDPNRRITLIDNVLRMQVAMVRDISYLSRISGISFIY